MNMLNVWIRTPLRYCTPDSLKAKFCDFIRAVSDIRRPAAVNVGDSGIAERCGLQGRWSLLAITGLLPLLILGQASANPSSVGDGILLTNAGKHYWCGSSKIASMNIYYHPLRVVDIHTREITTIGGMQEYVYLGCSHDSRWLIHQSIGYDPKRPETMGVVYAMEFETGKRVRLFSYPRPLYPHNTSFSDDGKLLFFTVTKDKAINISQRNFSPWRLIWVGKSLGAIYPQLREPVRTQTGYVIRWQPDGAGLAIHMQSDHYPEQQNPILLFAITSEQGPIEKSDLVSVSPQKFSDERGSWAIDNDRQLYLRLRQPQLGKKSLITISRCDMRVSPAICRTAFELADLDEKRQAMVVTRAYQKSLFSPTLYGGKRSIPCGVFGTLDAKQQSSKLHTCIWTRYGTSPDGQWEILEDKGDIRVVPITDSRLRAHP